MPARRLGEAALSRSRLEHAESDRDRHRGRRHRCARRVRRAHCRSTRRFPQYGTDHGVPCHGRRPGRGRVSSPIMWAEALEAILERVAAQRTRRQPHRGHLWLRTAAWQRLSERRCRTHVVATGPGAATCLADRADPVAPGLADLAGLEHERRVRGDRGRRSAATSGSHGTPARAPSSDSPVLRSESLPRSTQTATQRRRASISSARIWRHCWSAATRPSIRETRRAPT